MCCRAQVSDMLLPLRALIGAMAARDRLPQIELAAGDATTALVLRHLEPLATDDLDRLRAFGAAARRRVVAAAQGPRFGAPLDAGESRLDYTLPEFGIRMPFRPTDFTQVNRDINRALVSRAVGLLAPEADESRHRLVLRPRQLQPAAGDAGRLGAGHRRQRGARRARRRRGRS